MNKEPRLNLKAFPYVQKCGEGANPLKMYRDRMRAMFGPQPEQPATTEPAKTP